MKAVITRAAAALFREPDPALAVRRRFAGHAALHDRRAERNEPVTNGVDVTNRVAESGTAEDGTGSAARRRRRD